MKEWHHDVLVEIFANDSSCYIFLAFFFFGLFMVQFPYKGFQFLQQVRVERICFILKIGINHHFIAAVGHCSLSI